MNKDSEQLQGAGTLGWRCCREFSAVMVCCPSSLYSDQGAGIEAIQLSPMGVLCGQKCVMAGIVCRTGAQ